MRYEFASIVVIPGTNRDRNNVRLVCIVADLLDMFNVESTKGQAREVSILIRELGNSRTV